MNNDEKFNIISSILVKIKLFIIAFIIFKIGIDSLVLNKSSLKKLKEI